jgi:hypothetical protein
MNPSRRHSLARIARLVAVIALGANALVHAAPGAHGPDGEHLDQKSTNAARAGPPRVDAHSEMFELVAVLNGGVLTILLDRYETNEPVLGAKLELDSGAHRAVATFRADSGDYAVTDTTLLKALAVPGEHALVFTVTAGSDADLLDGTLVVSSNAAAARNHSLGHTSSTGGHGHDHALTWMLWVAAIVVGIAALGAIAWRRMRHVGNGHEAVEVR